jgi:hypothetical protein
VKPIELDQVRDALQRGTEQFRPVGPGVEVVQRRASRRRNRGRALVAVATVTCLLGAGVALSHRQGGKHVVAVGTQPTAPPPALAFRVVAGEVGYSAHFTSSDGVTYALSTAPGTSRTPTHPGQAIYSTKDGEHWTVADQGHTWITDLTEGSGVLYAIGTAPGAANSNEVRYQIGTSHDGGQRWTNTDLPVDQRAPSATVPLQLSTSALLARRGSTTVALVTDDFSPDLDAMVAARTAGHPDVMPQATAAGFDMVDYSACSTATASDNGKCNKPPVLGTITWSDIGLHSGADLTRQEILVSTDGTHWEHVTAPMTGLVVDLVAGRDGFLLLADPGTLFGGPAPGTQTNLFGSTDARTWTKVPTPADLTLRAIAGDRVIGIHAGVMQTSTDGGRTWNATNLAAQLPAGAPRVETSTLDAGPLGFAAVASADTDPVGPARGPNYLLYSTDGVTWSTSDLAAAGAPAGARPLQVMVGTDHIVVDFEEPSGGPNRPPKITTVLATPKR